MIHYPSKAESITSAMLLNSEPGEVNTTAQVSPMIERYAPNQKIKTVYTHRTLKLNTFCTAMCPIYISHVAGELIAQNAFQ